MSERKVLNKYYPPDFDPTKIPRVRQNKNRAFAVRLMAPCNMRCDTCGEYIYKGKKFNARKEDVENDTYLGIRIYRFYIKCTRCLAEISFKTDPQATDYVIEAGATRNFMALKLAEEQAEREEKAEREEESTNPMKLLEKRTQASRHEMAVLEALEELKELNQRQVVPDTLTQTMLTQYDQVSLNEAQKQEEEDEEYIKSIFGKDGDATIKRLVEDEEESDEEGGPPPPKLFAASSKSTDILANPPEEKKETEKSIGSLSFNKKLLVKPKAKVNLIKPPSATSDSGPSSIPKSTGLSLLGSYSSSDSE